MGLTNRARPSKRWLFLVEAILHRISRGKFHRLLRATTEFTSCVFDRYGLRDHLPAPPTLTPQIRFLYIGSRICSTLPSDPASRRRPCASLSLHLYQVVKRTYTSQLSNMRGVPKKGRLRSAEPARRNCLVLDYDFFFLTLTLV